MARAITDLYPDVRIAAPGVSDFVALYCLTRALSEFLDRSEAWREHTATGRLLSEIVDGLVSWPNHLDDSTQRWARIKRIDMLQYYPPEAVTIPADPISIATGDPLPSAAVSIFLTLDGTAVTAGVATFAIPVQLLFNVQVLDGGGAGNPGIFHVTGTRNGAAATEDVLWNMPETTQQVAVSGGLFDTITQITLTMDYNATDCIVRVGNSETTGTDLRSTRRGVCRDGDDITFMTEHQLRSHDHQWHQRHGGRPLHFTRSDELALNPDLDFQLSQHTVRLYPQPTIEAIGELRARVVVVTDAVADFEMNDYDDQIPQLPDRIFYAFRNAIVSGALAQLYLTPGKDWTNEKLASWHAQKFEEAIVMARSRADLDYNNAVLTVQYGGI